MRGYYYKIFNVKPFRNMMIPDQDFVKNIILNIRRDLSGFFQYNNCVYMLPLLMESVYEILIVYGCINMSTKLGFCLKERKANQRLFTEISCDK